MSAVDLFQRSVVAGFYAVFDYHIMAPAKGGNKA